jgi:hypothetical protein
MVVGWVGDQRGDCGGYQLTTADEYGFRADESQRRIGSVVSMRCYGTGYEVKVEAGSPAAL